MKNENGFTLIEIMISLAVISISFTILLSVFTKTLATTAESGILTSAVMLAEEKIALVGEKKFPEPGVSDWKEDVRYPNYSFRTTVKETPFEGARLVAVDVQYNERPEFTLENYVIEK